MRPLRANDYLTKEERQRLIKKDNWKAGWQVVETWGWIAAMFLLVGLFPNVLTIIVALFVLGGKQLGCSIIMHDTSHYALFTNRKVNDFVGKWLGSYPIWSDMLRYRPYHLEHHVHTGTEKDPDLGLTVGYPTTKNSMKRKFFRDLTGMTGVKTQLFGNLATHLGLIEYSLGGGKPKKIDQKGRTFSEFMKTAYTNLHGPVISNLVLFAILWLVGAPWLYLLWVGALLTTFNFSIRVRSIAEHSMVENPLDPIRNTRTTYAANWLEKLLFAPNNVNYHLEHHLLMSVPSYNLPEMHRLLLERGFYEKGLLEKGYWRIIKQAAGYR